LLCGATSHTWAISFQNLENGGFTFISEDEDDYTLLKCQEPLTQ